MASPRRAVSALAFLVALAPQAVSDAPTAVERARTVLARVGDPSIDPPLELESAIPRLAALGVDALPVYVTAWSARGTSGERRAAALGAARELPSNSVGERLRAVSSSRCEPARRIGAVRLLAELGHRDALDAWIASNADLADEGLPGSQIESDASDALLALLRAVPSEHGRLASRVGRMEPALLPLVVRAVGAAAQESGIDVLERVLARDPGLESACSDAIGVLCALHPGDDAIHALERVRERLDDRDAQRRVNAALTLGRALDARAAPLLADRLEDEDPLVARAALIALRGLSGHAWNGDVDRWRAWCDAEERWRARRLDELLRVVQGPNSSIALGALQELAAHPLHAHAIALGLGDALESARGAVATSIVRVLGALGSGAADATLCAIVSNDDHELAREVRALFENRHVVAR